MNKDEKFVYNYSAKQQKEVKEIRDKYLPKQEDKLDEMRKLDKTVTQKATMVAIAIGIISTLILGVGMCCTMVWQDTMFLPGVVIGIIGLIGIGVTMPIFHHSLKSQRRKIADEIIRLSKEFENENLSK